MLIYNDLLYGQWGLVVVALVAILIAPALTDQADALSIPSAVSKVKVDSYGIDYVTLILTAPTGDYPPTDYDILYVPTTNPPCGTGSVLFTLPNGAQACRFEGETNSTNLTITVTGLTANKSYTFYPIAQNDAGDSVTFKYISQTTASTATVPGAPTSLAAKNPRASTMDLAWTAPAKNGGAWITDYIVQYKLTTTTSWTTFADGVSQATSATITGLDPSKRYDFQVAAKNSVGTGSYSRTATGSTEAIRTPDAPTLLTAKDATGSKITLNWMAPEYNGGASITDYIIRHTTPPTSNNWTTFPDGASNSTSAIVTGLSATTLYGFQVAAVNYKGTGTYSTTMPYSTTVATPPSSPTSLAASPSNTSSALSWTAPADDGGATVTDYSIRYKKSSALAWTLLEDGVSASMSGTVPELSAFSSYDFQVAARNAAGTGTYGTTTNSTSAPTAPGVPTLLVPANHTGRSSVPLVWTHPTDDGGAVITDYIVRFKPSNSTAWTTFADGTSVSTYATVTGLNSSTSYDFAVAAKNSAATGSYSGIMKKDTIDKPAAPTSVSAGTASSSTINLGWIAPGDAGAIISDYTIRFKPSSSNSWSIFDDGVSVMTSATITGLDASKSYDFEISAKNRAGSSAYSGTITGSTIGMPDAPTSPTAGASTASSVPLSWTAPSSTGGKDISDYIIRYKEQSATSWKTFHDGISTTTSATVSGLDPSTAYEFEIAAKSTTETGGYSSTVAKSTTAATPVPGKPTSVAVGDPAATSVPLSWTAPSQGTFTVSGYTIQHRTPPATGTWQSSTTTPSAIPSTGTSAVITGLAPSTPYEFRVIATDSTTDVISDVTPGATLAAKPSGLSAGTATTGSAMLAWTAPAGGGIPLEDYVIQYRKSGATGWTEHARSTAKPYVTSETVTGLNPSTAYEFRIAAKNGLGPGAYSGIIQKATLPNAPTGLAATAAPDGSVKLGWTAPSGGSEVTKYTTQYRMSAAGTAPAGNWAVHSEPSTISGTISGLLPSTTYDFRVLASNESGQSTSSAYTTKATVPGKPTDLDAVRTIALGVIPLVWTAPAGGDAPIIHYTSQYKESSNSTWLLDDDTWTVTSGGGVRELESNTSYDIRVAAKNAAGTGEYSNAITRETIPGKPTSTVATASPDSVSLTWTKPAGGNAITDYTIYYGPPGSRLAIFEDGVSAMTSATITGLAPATSYSFEVEAKNSSGRGLPSVTATKDTIPGKVTGLAAGNATSSSVPLSWSKPVGGTAITDYTIQFKKESAAEWSTFADGTSVATSGTVTGLAPSTSYEFKVAAKNNSGTGEYSDDISKATMPGKPTGVTPGDATTSSVTLNWTKPSGGNVPITDYIIEYRTSKVGLTPAGNWILFDDNTSDATSTMVTSLVASTSYDFRVAAKNPVQGMYSDYATMATMPGKVTGLVSGATKHDSVSLSWIKPVGGPAITDYIIQHRTPPTNGTWVTFKDGMSNSTSSTVTGLVPSTPYAFQVAAKNDSGRGEYSDDARGDTRPGKPTDVTPGNATTSSMKLDWTKPSGGTITIKDYIVEYRTAAVGETPAGSWNIFKDGMSNSTSSTVTGLDPSTSYDFQVAAKNPVQGPYSDYATKATIPGKVTGLVPGAATTASIVLDWTKPSGGPAITDYIVQYRTPPSSGDWLTFDDGVSDNITATVTGLVPSTQYEFKVAAKNNSGTGDYSDPKSKDTIPGKVTGLVPGAATTASIVLDWTKPSGGPAITDYIVQYRTPPTSGTWMTFNDGESTTTYATVTNLTASTQYEFKVAAKNNSGTGDYSDPKSKDTIPGKPTSLAAGTATTSSMALSWTKPSGGPAITDYVIQHRTPPTNGTWVTFNDGTSNSTSALVTGLTASTSYGFQVAAKNASGDGDYSDSASKATIPGKVTGLSPGTATTSSIALSWTKPSGGYNITDYTVQYRTPPTSGNWLTFDDGKSNSTSTTITSLLSSTLYGFQVAAKNNSGDGDYSETATKSTAQAPAPPPRVYPPSVPTNLVVTNSTSSTIHLDWGVPSRGTVTGYIVEYKEDKPGNTTWIVFSRPSNTEETVTGLKPDTAYNFQVAAENQGRWGPYASVDGKTLTGPPCEPKNLTATPFSSTQMTLRWDVPECDGGPAITDYNIQLKKSSPFNASWEDYEDGPGTRTVVVVSGLDSSTDYNFRVNAENIKGTSDWSNKANGTTRPPPPVTTPPDKPTNIRVGSITASQFTVSWDAPANTGSAPLDYYNIASISRNPPWPYPATPSASLAVQGDEITASSMHVTNTPVTSQDYVSAELGPLLHKCPTSAPPTTRTVSASPNTAYKVSVQATNCDHRSSGFAPYLTVLTKPGVPTGLKIKSFDSSSVTLEWNRPVGGPGSLTYVVQYKLSSANSWSTFGSSHSGTSVKVTGLTEKTGYDFRVAAKNAFMAGEYSGSISGGTWTVPSAPRGLAVYINSITSTTVPMAVHSPADTGGRVDSYPITATVVNSCTSTSSVELSLVRVELLASNLTPNTSYQFTVAATNPAGTGPPSNMVCATTLP